MGYFYVLCRANVTMAIAGGWIFMSRMHQILIGQQIILPFSIIQGRLGPKDFLYTSHPGKNPVTIQSTESDEHPPVKGDGFHVDRCYHPRPSTDFPLVGVLLIRPSRNSSPILFAFRITRYEKELDVNEHDLCRADNLDLP